MSRGIFHPLPQGITVNQSKKHTGMKNLIRYLMNWYKRQTNHYVCVGHRLRMASNLQIALDGSNLVSAVELKIVQVMSIDEKLLIFSAQEFSTIN